MKCDEANLNYYIMSLSIGVGTVMSIKIFLRIFIVKNQLAMMKCDEINLNYYITYLSIGRH